MNYTTNLCIYVLCFMLLVGTARAAPAFTKFLAYGNPRQKTNSLLPIIAYWVNESLFDCLDAHYTSNDGMINMADTILPIIPHGEKMISLMTVPHR